MDISGGFGMGLAELIMKISMLDERKGYVRWHKNDDGSIVFSLVDDDLEEQNEMLQDEVDKYKRELSVDDDGNPCRYFI